MEAKEKMLIDEAIETMKGDGASGDAIVDEKSGDL